MTFNSFVLPLFCFVPPMGENAFWQRRLAANTEELQRA
jgi:hypothetical protein